MIFIRKQIYTLQSNSLVKASLNKTYFYNKINL
jgi:hypothetical protein